jgi:hypothetical protein
MTGSHEVRGSNPLFSTMNFMTRGLPRVFIYLSYACAPRNLLHQPALKHHHAPAETSYFSMIILRGVAHWIKVHQILLVAP